MELLDFTKLMFPKKKNFFKSMSQDIAGVSIFQLLPDPSTSPLIHFLALSFSLFRKQQNKQQTKSSQIRLF